LALAQPLSQPPDLLTFDGLVAALRESAESFPDPRTGKNTRYALSDIALAAFAVFFMQEPSFLAFQRQMEQAQGRNNAKGLFGIEQIPCDNHIRQLLDQVAASHCYPLFWRVFRRLETSATLAPYRVLDGQLLVALDGTQYFSSSALFCSSCSRTEHANGEVVYSHHAITPVVVAPGHHRVINLEPEFIAPQDGATKQDSETAAAKRWIHRNAAALGPHTVTLLGDDLYCHQPMCQLITEQELNLIFVCKRSSHPTLYEWVDGLANTDDLSSVRVERRRGKRRSTETYRFVNDVPLRDGADALNVNWCELTITSASGKRTYTNAFATNHRLTEANVVELVAAGRARWKIENENNNILKTKGYHLEHNFGHGQRGLSALLVTFNLLAHLFHTVLELRDQRYQAIRKARGRRMTLFDDLRALTIYLYFESWDALMAFMMEQLELPPPDTS